MRPQIVKISSLLCCFIIASPIFGQGPSASSGPPTPTKGPVFPELPIDSYLSILLVIGFVYGACVLYKKKTTTNNLR